MQTQDPHLNCYGFACGVLQELRKKKVVEPDVPCDWSEYLHEPIWRLMGYSSPSEMKIAEATMFSCCRPSMSSFSDRVHLHVQATRSAQQWGDCVLVKNFLKTSQKELQAAYLESWRAFRDAPKKDRQCGMQIMRFFSARLDPST